MKHKFYSQRGAMFGLDARIAMAIIASLSLVGGMTMFTTSSEVKAKALVKDLESYKAAIEGMQYDLKMDIKDAVATASPSVDAFRALNDKSLLTAAAQVKWLGPYIKSRLNDISIHENYGAIRINTGSMTDISASASCGGNCHYWLRIDDVPFKDFMTANDLLDGAGETDPDTTGRLQWRADGGGGPDRIFYRAGKTL